MKTNKTAQSIRRELEEAEDEVANLEEDLLQAEKRRDALEGRLEKLGVKNGGSNGGSMRCRCGEMFSYEEEGDAATFFNLRGEEIFACPGCALPCDELAEEIAEIAESA